MYIYVYICLYVCLCMPEFVLRFSNAVQNPQGITKKPKKKKKRVIYLSNEFPLNKRIYMNKRRLFHPTIYHMHFKNCRI